MFVVSGRHFNLNKMSTLPIRKEITKEDISVLQKMFLNPPPSKVEDLAKLFRDYITGEARQKLKTHGEIPLVVILNLSKIKDEDFFKLAIYSLDKYFNIRWICADSPESDAVTFVFLETAFDFYKTLSLEVEMKPIPFIDYFSCR